MRNNYRLIYLLILMFGIRELLSIEVGMQAPVLDFKTIKEKEFKTERLKGKVLLIDFWASWCTTCKASLKHYEEIIKKYKAVADFEVVTVSVDAKKKPMEKYIDRHDMKLEVVWDPEQKIAKLFDVVGIPSAFIIDQNGMIAFRYLGSVDSKIVESDLDKILSKLKNKKLLVST